MAKNIIVGQKVDKEKVLRAKEFRRGMIPEEKILWQHLRTNRLQGFHFRRQQVIDGFIADFYCHQAGLVVEVDGDIHRKQPGYDADRDRVLANRDIEVLRFKNSEISKNLDGVLVQISKTCAIRIRNLMQGKVPPSRVGKGVRGLGQTLT